MDSRSALRATSVLGMTSAIWLSGIHFSASHLTLPIMYRLPTDISTDFFEEFYERGKLTVAPLSAIATVGYATSAYLDPSRQMLFGAAAALTIAPPIFTVLFVAPVNDELIKCAKDGKVREKTGQTRIVSLLKTWKWMNNVRAVLAFAGGAIGVGVVAGYL